MFQFISYFSYWLNAIGAHSMQGPFVYELYKDVIAIPPNPIPEIEDLKRELLQSNQSITFEPLGAKSKLSSHQQKVKEIVRKGNSSIKLSCLLQRLANYIKAGTILDLGTSTGLNTSYLASTPESNVYTFEGNVGLVDLAKSNFSRLGLENINLIEGNIDKTLPPVLNSVETIDIAFIDANHRFEPTIKYFELLKERSHNNSVLVFDDIHWSKEMDQAWKHIVRDSDVTLSVDLFKVGLVFFKKELDKEHLIVEF